uniref:DNA-directed RNA polymerase n=1 Tax=Caulerpa okamurae TaxID=118247 RepID=A0A3S5FWT4_9CHLO|nr:RNA polymerase beta' subunit [Caulerpa okamurae]
MKIFFNHCFDKRRFQQFIHWFFKTRKGQSPHFQTIVFLEKLKNLGFYSAMKAGFSISLEDLKIPFSKSSLLLTAEKNIFDNFLTPIERSQAILEIWNRTSDKLKKQVLQSFQISDFFNPVYMMAFSGARGNISQIRQLVAMRGLMADPQGQIIDFPIRSNFREGLTLTEYLICCSGARKGIVDTALRTASSGYLTRRLVDVAHHVVISQIDCGTNQSLLVEDLYDQKKKILSLNQRLIGRVLAKNITDNKGQIIGYQNQEISKILSEKLCRFHQKIFIRSPLTCKSPQFVCQFCYGWNLAEGQLVSIGEAVGILAAQSIGEPGTQLTMRTFHTGGVFTGILIDQTYSPFSGFAYYPFPCSGLLIRTQQGQIAFLSKNILVLKIHQKKNATLLPNQDLERQNCQFHFQASTLLYAPQGQFVEKNQLLAEGTSQDYRFIENEQHILCSSSGELFFENLVFVEKKFNLIENKILQNLGEFWILSGQLFFHSDKSPKGSRSAKPPTPARRARYASPSSAEGAESRHQKRFHKLDLINKQVPFFQIQIQSGSNFVEKKYQIIFQTKIQNFSMDFLFFKKIAYFHYQVPFFKIQTWMAGLILKSKYKYNPSKKYFQKLSIQNLPNPFLKKVLISREKKHFYFKFENTFSFFQENFCVLNFNPQGFYLFNFYNLVPKKTSNFLKKVINIVGPRPYLTLFQKKLFLSKRFFTTNQYSFYFFEKRRISFILFHWQKAFFINKYHFLISFFKNLSRKTLKVINQKVYLYKNPLGYFCFFRIPILTSGFRDEMYYSFLNFQGPLLFNFEKFFVQGIRNTFLFVKSLKKTKCKKTLPYISFFSPARTQRVELSDTSASGASPSPPPSAKVLGVGRQPGLGDELSFFLGSVVQTKNSKKFDSYFLDNFRTSLKIPLLKIQKRTIDFYFDSFFSILRDFGFHRNFQTRFSFNIPKKPIFYNFDIFFSLGIINNSVCISQLNRHPRSQLIEILPLLDNQKKLYCYLNSVWPIKTKSLENKKWCLIGSIYGNRELTITKINILKKFPGQKIMQRNFFKKSAEVGQLRAFGARPSPGGAPRKRDLSGGGLGTTWQAHIGEDTPHPIATSAWARVSGASPTPSASRADKWGGSGGNVLRPPSFFCILHPSWCTSSWASQIFIRFFLPIQVGEIVDLISFEKEHILLNNFQHLFSFRKNMLRLPRKMKPLGSLYQSDLFNNKIFGQLIAQTQKSFLFRHADVYLLNNQSILHGFHGEIISKDQHICTVFFNQSKTGDIVQGIPKIEQIFEARKKSKYSFHEIALSAKNFFDFEKRIFFYLRNLQKSVLNNIQRIYCSQGIHISDKHIEIIVRQITSNVLILDPGQTGLLPGEVVEFQWISRVNSFLISNQILYEPLLMGMTKTCLETSSFISAASFQETTRILGQAALQNQIDFIRGLKQNVILGNIIPGGTGY